MVEFCRRMNRACFFDTQYVKSYIPAGIVIYNKCEPGLNPFDLL